MTARIVHGEALEVLRRVPANSFHALCTDPPAAIGFMSKSWDSDKGGRDAWIAWLAEIAAECFRTMRPGAHGFVWALPRTSHWTVTAFENAGFEIRDRVHHVFGSGMPHSKDASKAIDLYFDVPFSLRPVIGTYRAGGNAGTSTQDKGGTYAVGAPMSDAVELTRTLGATPEAKQWDGWQTNLKPGCEDWWLIRKPLEGTLAENLLKWGTGAINIDAGRVPRNWDERGEAWKRSGVTAQPDAEKIAAPPGQGMILHPGGGWPANIVYTHSAACVLEECSADCPVGQIDAQGGERKSCGRSGVVDNARNGYGLGERGQPFAAAPVAPSTGGASRYFNVFYRPKATRKEREAGCEEAGLPVRTGGEATGRKDGSAGVARPQAGAGRGGGRRNDHPTVKDIGTKGEPGLMRFLCRIITPKNGIVVDPFVGSGSTPVACVIDGFHCLGIDAEEHYCEIARARVAYWEQNK